MFKPLATGQIAERLGVSRETVRNYTAEFREFLSAEAVGVAANAKRRYSERDGLILATVASLRNQGIAPEQIREALAAGRLVDRLPDAPSPAEKEARASVALIARSEYERALDHVQVLEGELEQLRSERDRAIERWQDDTTDLNSRIQQLQLELGEAKGKLDSLERLLNERRPAEYWTRLLILAVIGMLIVLAVAVIFLSGRG